MTPLAWPMMVSPIDETWLDFTIDESMLALVNPNEICPRPEPVYECPAHHFDPFLNQFQTHQIKLQQLEQQQHQQQQHHDQHHHQQETIGQIQMQPPPQMNPTSDQDQFHQLQAVCDPRDQEQLILGPPPVLFRQQSFQNIQQQLDYRKAMYQQRHDELRARLDSEPLKLPPKIMRKASGKRMTGRERQLELEKTEARMVHQRDCYLSLIAKLEMKCNKLRDVLGNIVTNSPEYNNQLSKYLEEDGLLCDVHRNQ